MTTIDPPLAARLSPEDGNVFEAIVATVRQPLLALDGDLTVILANRAFRKFFGHAADEVEGRSLYEIGDGFWDNPTLRDVLRDVLDSHAMLEDYALELTRRDAGTRSLLVNARRLYVNGANLVVLAVEDVTERDGLERLVAERTSELEAFNYSVSHDLRAPLRALDGFSRALAEDYAAELGGEGRRYLRLISANAKQMGALIDGLLAFSRLGRQGMVRSPVDVRALVADVIEVLQPDLAGRDVQIAVGELPSCFADALLLRQVYANLIGNAVKFTGGREPARIEIGSHEVDGERVWFVRDDGVGFDMAFAGKLFETFQRLHRSDAYEGTGIGLALVQRIVQRHGGRIWAVAAENAGATFSFTVPDDR